MRAVQRSLIALGAAIALLALPMAAARADDDDWHGDRGWHRGWEHHHHRDYDRGYYGGPGYYGYYGAPVYVAPAPVYVPPPPVYYAPAYPAYAAPSLNVIVPLHIH